LADTSHRANNGLAPLRARQAALRGLLFRNEKLRGYSLLAPAFLVMAAGIMIPFAILVTMSFWTQTGFNYDTSFQLANYVKAAQQPIYETLILRSLSISGMATIATVLLCYPIAFYVAFHVHRQKMLWIILLTLPFWTSYLLRVFAWKTVLGFNGVINSALVWMGLINEPLEFLLYSQSAVIITLAHAWAPFAILPIYVSLEKIDRSLLEAATDLGDGPWRRFFRITLPLSLPGVIAATLLIFIPTVGDYITPALLGGPDGVMIGNMIQMQFGRINNWPMGAALSLIMMFCVALVAVAVMLGTRKLKGGAS
jgi:spermidine/putrescine transport system permease protein